MFQQLIEAIRVESSQSGGSQPKTSQAHSYQGRMHTAVGKKAQLKALKAQSRRQGKEAAASGDDGHSAGRPGGNKVPQHSRRSYDYGPSRKSRHRRLMRRNEETEGIRDMASKVVDKALPRRAKKRAAQKADDKRRNANYARTQASLKRAVSRIKTNY